MGNLFFGLNVGRSALIANQAALDVAGHNLANVQTEGYSRQKANLTASLPVQVGTQHFGSGVSLESVERIQVSWLERQINRVRSQNGYTDALQQGIDEIEAVLGEPSEEGVGAALTGLYDAWDALAVQPADAALRDQVLEAANHLAQTYNQKVDGLAELEKRFNEALVDDVDQVNALTAKLADLNGAVAKAEAGGRNAGDLRDQRDELVRQVAEKLGVEVEADGSYLSLRIEGGGPYILSRTESYAIEPGDVADGLVTDFRVGSGPARLSGGAIGARLELQGEISPELRGDLGDWVGTVTDRLNQLHGSGFDRDGQPGRNLFVWEGDASRVAVSSQVGLARVDQVTGLDPGTHHVEVVLTPNTADFPAGTSGLDLKASGSFAGSLAGADYQVEVVDGTTAPPTIRLLRDGAAVGDPAQAVPDADPASDLARWSWAGVDGLTFTATVDLSRSYAAADASTVLSAGVSLDGGDPGRVDPASGTVTLAGGGDRGFAAAGTAALAFTDQPFSGATFTVYAPGGRLGVDAVVAADPDRVVAAATAGASGDGEMARRIGAMSEERIFENTDENAAGHLARIVQGLGSKGRDVAIFGESGRSILAQLEAQKQGEVGVNMDEEMVLLIQHQRGFQAAARFLTTVDGLLETLINGVGR